MYVLSRSVHVCSQKCVDNFYFGLYGTAVEILLELACSSVNQSRAEQSILRHLTG